MNDLVWRALSKADIPAVKEPSGLLRIDSKRPDGVTQLPWRTGKCVTWDVMVIDTLASSYVPATSQTPGAVRLAEYSIHAVLYRLLVVRVMDYNYNYLGLYK